MAPLGSKGLVSDFEFRISKFDRIVNFVRTKKT